MGAHALRRWVLAVALVVVLAASQGLASASGSADETVGTGSAVGRAGFAYLGGLRKFAAAVLWNRIDPVFHDYYSDVTLSEQTYMLPSMYLVTALDPQFEQAYYVSSWVVTKRRGAEEGIAVARDGLENNKDSGLMHMNLLQLLYLDDPEANRDEMLRLIDPMLDDSLFWLDDEERFEGFAVTRDALLSAGDGMRAASVDRIMEQMRAAGIGEGDHDHDGDGKQDH